MRDLAELRCVLPIVLAAVAVALAAPRPARAAGQVFSLEAALGGALPGGSLSNDTWYLSNTYRGKVPLRLRAGWRPAALPRLDAALTFEAAAVVQNATTRPDDGLAGALAGGLDARVHLGKPGGPWDSSVALGVALSRLDGWIGARDAHERWTGFVLPRVEVSLARSYGGWWVGPYVAFEVERFSRYAITHQGATASYSIPNPALHYWSGLGVRVARELGSRR